MQHAGYCKDKQSLNGLFDGSRGNSGVITSQILRGIAEGLCDVKNPEAVTQRYCSRIPPRKEVA